MKLAGIELRFLINEISKKTLDYYVSNIYGINSESLLFKLHHPEKPDVLLMFSTLGIWTSSVKVNQTEKNKLLRRLRDDLLRLKLTKVEQIEAERIVYLTFSGFDKEFVLVGEFFGKGNIILCNKEKKILALLHSVDVRHRKLRVGIEYSPPPQNAINVFSLKLNDLDEISSSTLPAAKSFGRKLGLPTKYVEEIFRLSNVESKIAGNQLTKNEINKIFDSVNLVIDKVVNGKHEPVLIRNEKNYEIYPIKLGTDENYTSVPSFMEGLDKIFTEKLIELGKDSQSSVVSTKIAELKNQLEEQNKAIAQVKEKSEEISNVAKSLQNLASQGIFSMNDPQVLELLKKQNSQIIKENGISRVKIHYKKIKIELDSSMHAIVSKLFNESKHQMAAISSIEKIKEQTEKKLKKEEKQEKVAQESITFTEVRKKNWFERYRWFYTSDGILAIGGRDSSSNSAIIRKHIEKNDKVFHADIHGSPFFVLKDGKEPISPASLNEIAHATVCFSRAWREAVYGLNAYWVEPEQIKKAAPSGQFLPKGAFVIEGNRNFVNVASLKLAIGIIKQDTNYLVTCGPPNTIKKSSMCYVVIEPTGSEMTDVAKKIKSKFAEINEEIVKSISIDDFVRVLPAGKSHVVESGMGEQSSEN